MLRNSRVAFRKKTKGFVADMAWCDTQPVLSPNQRQNTFCNTLQGRLNYFRFTWFLNVPPGDDLRDELPAGQQLLSARVASLENGHLNLFD